MSKPYMPLMMGDWIKGTRGMRANVKGVYIGLLIHQYDNGFLPADIETLTLIEPEVGSVWVSLKDKFEEFEPGKLRNLKLEEVRAFWNKQVNNGKKGGRPKIENPKHNPKANPNHNHHTDIDHDIELILNRALDEIYIDQQRGRWPKIDFDFELETFREKVRGSPSHYVGRDTGSIRLAFQSQLRNAKPKPKGRPGSENDEQEVLKRTKNQQPQQSYGVGSQTSPFGSLE